MDTQFLFRLLLICAVKLEQLCVERRRTNDQSQRGVIFHLIFKSWGFSSLSELEGAVYVEEPEWPSSVTIQGLSAEPYRLLSTGLCKNAYLYGAPRWSKHGKTCALSNSSVDVHYFQTAPDKGAFETSLDDLWGLPRCTADMFQTLHNLSILSTSFL